MPMTNGHQALLLAGASEIRLARTPAEVERELASGFRPSVVLLDMGANAARGEAFAERVASHPACAAIPILGISGDDERVRLTLMNDVDALSNPSHLPELLRILEDLCLDLPGAGFPGVPEVEPDAPASHTAEQVEEPETAC